MPDGFYFRKQGSVRKAKFSGASFGIKRERRFEGIIFTTVLLKKEFL